MRFSKILFCKGAPPIAVTLNFCCESVMELCSAQMQSRLYVHWRSVMFGASVPLVFTPKRLFLSWSRVVVVQVRQISLGTLGFVCDVAYVSHVYLFAAELFG